MDRTFPATKLATNLAEDSIIQCRHKDTGKPAIFTFAVLWAYNGNLRTGSYVPPGETIPKQTFLKTLYAEFPMSRFISDRTCRKREPSYMCDIAYGFDVTIDKEIYNCIQVRSRIYVYSE